jgi:ABC-type molybdate transport system ATPase subunit
LLPGCFAHFAVPVMLRWSRPALNRASDIEQTIELCDSGLILRRYPGRLSPGDRLDSQR